MVNLTVDDAPTNPAVATRNTANHARVRSALRVAVGRASGPAPAVIIERRPDLRVSARLGLNLTARWRVFERAQRHRRGLIA